MTVKKGYIDIKYNIKFHVMYQSKLGGNGRIASHILNDD